MIRLICGPMFSRKSEKQRELIQRCVYQRKKVHVFRPELDTRPELTTHAGGILVPGKYLQIERIVRGALLYPSAPDGTHLAVFDEAQFHEADVVHWVKAHDARGIHVLVSCLDRDYSGKPFGAIKELLFIADKVNKRTAVCVRCGRNATRTQRIVQDDSLVLVGEADKYEARCVTCHRP